MKFLIFIERELLQLQVMLDNVLALSQRIIL